MPSFCFGTGWPISSQIVGNTSWKPLMWAVVVPCAITPGHRASMGVRIPPSCISRLWPRKLPLEFQKSGLCPPSLCAPLSLANITSVFSSTFNSWSRVNIAPTSLSRCSIIAANPAIGFSTSGHGSPPAPYLPIFLSNCGNTLRHFSCSSVGACIAACGIAVGM